MRWRFARLLALILCMGCLAQTGLAADNADGGSLLKMVFIDANSPAEVKKLARMGIDIAAVRKLKTIGKEADLAAPAFRVEAVVSAVDEKKLQNAGIAWSAAQIQAQARVQAQAKAAGETVYHSFDEPTYGIKDQLLQIQKQYPKLCRLQSIGESIQNRPLLALCLTGKKTGRNQPDLTCQPNIPEVLFLATHHAREWVATQMAMRLIKYLAGNYGKDARITRLLNTTKIWIIPVANPDGYEYTFTDERLWRKNLRDNDGDNQITIADGVDINRNFDSHWGSDDEGSSPVWSDQTYRGSAPNSEPETKAVVKFVRQRKFKFILSYHTYSNLILYPWGWQVKTPSFDDPIFVAQAGTDDNPAIRDSLLNIGYDPGVGADLYTTNGDFTDWTYAKANVPSYTVELTLGYSSPEQEPDSYYGFEFPDDEAMVQKVFEDNLAFALCLAESARNPAKPVSPVGIKVENAYHTPVSVSYGQRQMIQVLARKGVPPILLYRINGGGMRAAAFTKMLGKTYNDRPGTYYCGYKAFIPRQKAQDEVTYYIVSHNTRLGPYGYKVESANASPILIVSAEDYTGDYPPFDPPLDGPQYLNYYTEALDAGGYAYDVWDVTQKAAAPSFAEVLSSYEAAIWYTGDDYAPTVPGFSVHEDTVLAFRDFLNYRRGKLFATGQDLGYLSAVYGMFNDDFFQYTLGAYRQVDEAGLDPETSLPLAVQGEADDPVFSDMSFNLTGGDGADNQSSPDSFLATSYFLPKVDSHVAARYVRPGGPFEPHSGDNYVYSQMADQAYKRLGGTFSLPDGAPSLKFWISYDIEPDWDYAFVEIRPVGSDEWTTLPDKNGLTQTATGESCKEGWVEQIHPHLAHYMDTECNPTGTSGDWHAFTGNSAGWKQVEFDLSAYAGQDVELYISYASDWGTQLLGAFIDDIELSGAELQDFETDLGDWQATSTEGNAPFNNWVRMTGAGFPEGPAIRTADSVYLGFGFEAVDTLENRATLMDRIMKYLGQ
jgi:murein tripeptide amidase MpaA